MALNLLSGAVQSISPFPAWIHLESSVWFPFTILLLSLSLDYMMFALPNRLRYLHISFSLPPPPPFPFSISLSLSLTQRWLIFSWCYRWTEGKERLINHNTNSTTERPSATVPYCTIFAYSFPEDRKWSPVILFGLFFEWDLLHF